MKKWSFLAVFVCLGIIARGGNVPEVKDKADKKKVALKSELQKNASRNEVPAPDPNPEDDPKAVAAALPTPLRGGKIAQLYQELANASGGAYYDAITRPLLDVLDELLQQQLVKGADVAFVIDHTSSMEDDIDNIRLDIQKLISRFDAAGDVRVGIVSFSDVKSGLKSGYGSTGLSADYSGLSDFLGKIELIGSIEDIYGAIWKTVDEFKWQSKTKRLIVLISDDKPAASKDSNYSEEDVIAKCALAAVNTNVYPVLVDKYSPVQH
ncbi:MAG: VWA domain-containing protein [Bacteroidia bacterium]|nr:VWA domain-containing protein [Bacteroidia bacterium]